MRSVLSPLRNESGGSVRVARVNLTRAGLMSLFQARRESDQLERRENERFEARLGLGCQVSNVSREIMVGRGQVRREESVHRARSGSSLIS